MLMRRDKSEFKWKIFGHSISNRCQSVFFSSLPPAPIKCQWNPSLPFPFFSTPFGVPSSLKRTRPPLLAALTEEPPYISSRNWGGCVLNTTRMLQNTFEP